MRSFCSSSGAGVLWLVIAFILFTATVTSTQRAIQLQSGLHKLLPQSIPVQSDRDCQITSELIPGEVLQLTTVPANKFMSVKRPGENANDHRKSLLILAETLGLDPQADAHHLMSLLKDNTTITHALAANRMSKNLTKPDAATLVSVVTPTTLERQQHFTFALNNFLRQTYRNKELIVVTSSLQSAQPLSFWKRAVERYPGVVKYHHIHCKGDNQANCSLGGMRNHLHRLARGGLIAAFDDDDYYDAAYLRLMLEQLSHHGADVIKLGNFDWCDVRINNATFKTARVGEFGTLSERFGYGFSYVYNRVFDVLDCSFENVAFSEDWKWVQKIANMGGKVVMLYRSPCPGIAVKMQYYDGHRHLSVPLYTHVGSLTSERKIAIARAMDLQGLIQ